MKLVIIPIDFTETGMRVTSTIVLHCFPAGLVMGMMLLLILVPGVSGAVEWQKLTQTARYKVSIEMDSIQEDASGVVKALLKFVPRGELQRRSAADAYGYKDYLSHTERYEIDCAKKTARLEYLEVLGWRGKKLTHTPGNGQRDVIVPGTVLDKVAILACPDEENGAEENETPEVGAGAAHDESHADTLLLSLEARQRIDDAQRRATTEPGSFSAWVELGNAWYDADMPRQAIEAYDRALALKPDDTDVLNDQGAMYRQAGNIPHALANFEKALSIDPGNLDCLYNMGYVYAFDLNKAERAMKIWQQYLTLDGTSERAEQVRTFLKQHENSLEKR